MYESLLNSNEFIDKLKCKMMSEPFVWGDRTRVHVHETANMVNTLFNASSGSISIDAYTFTGHNVCILAGTHMIDKKMQDRMGFPKEGCDISVGKGVWLASNVTILGPCVIGDNAVVAAGAVVLPNTVIPPNTLYAGVPAKFVKEL